MLACIPTNGETGLDDSVHDHFGSAPFFTLYDTEADKVTVLANRNAHHDHGTCHPMNQLAHYRIDCVVCAGLGRRAIEALNSEGIKVYQAESKTVGELVQDIKAEKLTEIDPSKACRGQGQRRDFIHDPDGDTAVSRGQGRGAGYGQCGRDGGGLGGRGQGDGQGRGQGGGRRAATGQQRNRRRG